MAARVSPIPKATASPPAAAPRPSGSATSPLLDPEFLHKLEQLELVSRRIFVGRMKGERKSKRRGSSVEFAEHRNYTFGDDLRHIDWNVYGRLDKLFLKLFLEEEDLHVYTLLDTSLSMDFGNPTKLRYGKQVAAALSFIGLVNHDRVLVDTFSARLDQGLHGIRGRSQMWRIVAVPRPPRGHRPEQLDRGGPRVRDPPRGQGRRRRHLRLPRQERIPGRPALFAGAKHGHLRHPHPERKRKSSPSWSETSAWSTAKTTRPPRSPSAPHC